MGTLVELKNAIFKKLIGAPGKSLSVDLKTIGDSTDDGELYHTPGVFSKPHDHVIGVAHDINGFNIVVGTHDYKYDKDIDKGEAILYSIDADGNVLSSAKVNKDGKFIVNDGTKYAARKNDAVVVTIPAGTFIVSVSGGLGAAAVGTLNPFDIDVDGIITEGSNVVLLP